MHKSIQEVTTKDPTTPFLAYVCASGGFSCKLVPLMHILRNKVFFKSQNPQKAGSLCMLHPDFFKILI